MSPRLPSRPPSVALLAALLAACSPGPEPSGTGATTQASGMVEITEAVGLDFRHENGMTGELYFCEIVGAGVALLDVDGDGDLDLYLVQGGPLAPGVEPDPSLTDRLFRNDLVETGELRFVDVTEESGLQALGYGMGVAAGDVDNDGRVDLYLANFGPNELWIQEEGDGGGPHFREVTAAAGVEGDRWSTSAAFVDFDRDGWLDLYVTNYTDFRVSNHKPCALNNGRPEYCGPKSYDPEPDRLWRNLGPGPDGTVRFEDVSGAAGILDVAAAGLGVVTADLDHDGWMDIYAANDQDRNLLWINDQRGGFVEQGLLSGSATNAAGLAESSMGIDAADFDADGDEDLFMTHIDEETNTLYVNDGSGLFRDATAEVGVGPPSLGATGFGAVFFDLENDGWLDLAVVNGAVLLGEGAPGESRTVEMLGQANHLLASKPGPAGRIFDPAPSGSPPWTRVATSRGLAVGDLDNDGDQDLVLTNNNGPARVLRNEHPTADDWLGLRLVDEEGLRDQLGARVVLRRREAPDLVRRVRTDGSYLSARDPRVHFGLAEGRELEALEVQWPDGTTERWSPPPIGRYTTLRRGSGETSP